MASIKRKPGDILLQAEQNLTELYIITSGSVTADFSGNPFTLKKGDVLCLADLESGVSSCSYIAQTEVSLASYPYENPTLFYEQLASNREMCQLFLTSAIRFILAALRRHEKLSASCKRVYKDSRKGYAKYREICTLFSQSPKSLPGLDELEPFVPETDIERWLIPYYKACMDFDPSVKTAIYQNMAFAAGMLRKTCHDTGLVLEACRDMAEYMTAAGALILNENRLDFFDLYANLYFRTLPAGDGNTGLATMVDEIIEGAKSSSFISPKLCEKRAAEYRERLELLKSKPDSLLGGVDMNLLTDSLHTILSFGKCEEALAARFRQSIDAYKKLMDKNDASDTVGKLRRSLTKDFYLVYSDVFWQTLAQPTLPPAVKLFLSFGYVDDELAGLENAAYLLSLADTFHGAPNYGIYTFYEWLMAILEGDKEPSRNEFDLDFSAWLHEQKMMGKITSKEEARMAEDNAEKVRFELANLFPIANKITFGRISTYCPLFSDHNVLKHLEDALASPRRISEALHAVRNIDFTAFYRETLYTNQDYGISREYIQIQIMPDIILMPNIGTRASMWQEIEGRRRTTPCRMLLPVFPLEDLNQLFIRLTGEYRWEMCKRVQGARWNDISDPSLTSDYCDYAQFYRKNHDLSSDAKEKIKLSLQKAKNNYREMFIQDYATWLTFEGNGSPRLNKVARGILFAYCPFNAAIRERLKNNPLYKEVLERYRIKIEQRKQHLENVCARIERKGGTVPDTLNRQLKLLDN